MVITGGPGTGKTTIINAVLKIFGRIGIDIQLAAPTGRAAKRMKEATGREAKTHTQVAGIQPPEERLSEERRASLLKCDLLVIDEASMIDTVLMYHLLKTVPLHATVILVGDVNQLPIGRARQCAQGHHLIRGCAGRPAQRDLPAGQGQRHHRECAPHQQRDHPFP